jgi:hypothetical protein
MYQLVDVYDGDVLGEYVTIEDAIKVMEKIFHDAYPEDGEQVDYECCNSDELYATDSSGERWLEIKTLAT